MIPGAHATELCYAVQLVEPFRKVIHEHPAATPEIRSYLGNYARLVNDPADFRLESHGPKTYAILHSIVPLSRASADFGTAAFYLTVTRKRPELARSIEVWFTHEAPADLSQYQKTFGASKVVFSAPLDALIFDSEALDVPASNADANLHALLRTHVEHLIAGLPPARGFIASVREHIFATMPDGTVSADRVAERLHMSRRSLTRHLGEAGHTFKALLDESRRHSAGYYLQTTELSIEDIAVLLGYSESAAFVRAFKRWTQSTPGEYRRAHRVPGVSKRA